MLLFVVVVVVVVCSCFWVVFFFFFVFEVGRGFVVDRVELKKKSRRLVGIIDRSAQLWEHFIDIEDLT